MPRAKKVTKEVEVVYINEPQTKTNGLAVASFILALCGIFTFGFSTILGFILGIVAQHQIKQSGERGEGLATTAIVLGSILIAFGFIGWIVGIQL